MSVQRGIQCSVCQRQTLHVRSQAISPAAAILLILVTGGLGLLVLLAMMATHRAKWRCQTCGNVSGSGLGANEHMIGCPSCRGLTRHVLLRNGAGGVTVLRCTTCGRQEIATAASLREGRGAGDRDLGLVAQVVCVVTLTIMTIVIVYMLWVFIL